jgi:hypothetical protein
MSFKLIKGQDSIGKSLGFTSIEFENFKIKMAMSSKNFLTKDFSIEECLQNFIDTSNEKEIYFLAMTQFMVLSEEAMDSYKHLLEKRLENTNCDCPKCTEEKNGKSLEDEDDIDIMGEIRS